MVLDEQTRWTVTPAYSISRIAVSGAITYDLVSLLARCLRRVARTAGARLDRTFLGTGQATRHRCCHRTLPTSGRPFELMGLQRHLKVAWHLRASVAPRWQATATWPTCRWWRNMCALWPHAIGWPRPLMRLLDRAAKAATCDHRVTPSDARHDLSRRTRRTYAASDRYTAQAVAQGGSAKASLNGRSSGSEMQEIRDIIINHAYLGQQHRR